MTFPRFLILFFLGGFVLLAVRTVDLQAYQGDFLLQLAEENRFYKIIDQPHRGAIVDRYGELLAENNRYYVEPEDVTALYSRTQRIDHDQALQIQATNSATIQLKTIRNYPVASFAAQVVGYVGPVSAEERSDSPELSLDQVVGKTGIERVYDEQLRGQPGWREYEINALAQRQRLVKSQEPMAGQTVYTTLDPYLSAISTKALGDKKGAVVITDAATGAVLTLVSSPSYDPNSLAALSLPKDHRNEEASIIQSLLSDPNRPFFNRALSGSYPPGSVFKLVTALAGLETGKLDQTVTVRDEGVLKVGDFSYANWYYTQFGRTEGDINLTRSLARSNDIYFYKAAEWIGPTALADMARMLGLGKVPELGIGPETAGLVPDPAWKERVVGERWFLGNTYHYGIGQGDIGVSPVQMAKVVQGFAHKGTQCGPYVVEAVGEVKQQRECYELGVQEKNIDIVLDGMIQACSSGGTAFPFFPHNQKYFVEGSIQDKLDAGMVACKTGTAEFGPADERGYRATHAWLVAIVEPKLLPSDSGELTAESEQTSVERAAWLEQLRTKPLPKRLVIVALVESDEIQKYREGSRDTGAVVATIVETLFP